MRKILIISIFLIFIQISRTDDQINVKPIIGILTLPSEPEFYPYYPASNYSYIYTPYIKFIQGAGSRAAVIPYDLPQDQILSLMQSVNGIFLIGGKYHLWTESSNGTKTPTDIYKIMQFMISTALDWNLKGEFYPVWGTGQGMNVILSVLANDLNILDSLKVPGQNKNLQLLPKAISSKLYSLLTSDLWEYVQGSKFFWTKLNYGITSRTFANCTRLSNLLNALTISYDEEEKEYLTSVEGKDIPFYAVAYHPEINSFDWANEEYSHTFHSIKASQKLAYKFVNDNRLNFNSFANQTYENQSLIYNYNVTMLPGYNTAIFFFPNYNQSKNLQVYG